MLPSDLQHALIQQADKISGYKSTKDRIATTVEAKLALTGPDAMDCDEVQAGTEWGHNSEAGDCDVDAVSGEGAVQCHRCGGQGHIAAKCATLAPAKGKDKDGGTSGGKGVGSKGKGKGE